MVGLAVLLWLAGQCLGNIPVPSATEDTAVLTDGITPGQEINPKQENQPTSKDPVMLLEELV